MEIVQKGVFATSCPALQSQSAKGTWALRRYEEAPLDSKRGCGGEKRAQAGFWGGFRQQNARVVLTLPAWRAVICHDESD